MVQILDQRYETEELIGSGGMADVYRGKDKLLDRTVAIKVLHPQYRNDAEFIGKFHQEAQAAARLSHANIVNIYDVGVSGDEHYIVMEYVPGATLKDLIQQNGKLPIAEALRIAREIAQALAHAHANNLVHCDIKPHNILIMPDGQAKVADFGIARAVTESTMTYSGNVVGSVHYFSPEQAKGSFITPKSDVYSLGVVMYEMLAGALPFNGETPVSIAMKHLQENPTPLRTYRPEVPPVVEAIVMKAMSKDPAMRPDSAELVQDLQQAERMMGGGASSAQDPFATQLMPRVTEGELATYQRQPGYVDTSEKEEKSVLGSKLFILGLVLVLFLGFGVGAFLSFGKFWSNQEATVPDVVGKQMTLARQILEDAHLRVNVAETYDAEVPAGQVVSQSPEAEATVKEQRLVTIYVSKGGEDLEMPDLTGLTRADAENKLKKMGLKLGDGVYEKYSSEEPGTVIGQDVRAGSKITKGQSVDITVSKGEKTKRTTVPNIVGGTLSAAESSLKSHGLRVGTVSKTPSAQAEGTVVSQSPVGGSDTDEGTSVDLTVAEPEKSSSRVAVEDKTTNESNAASESENSAETNVPSRTGATGRSR
ncbi:MAG: Stk1 family PASTA domain-containing Ser/Thr kinase [Selenomonadaceae bacterium]|nr:Stk1 family PASTA domain-containing Ser/Thr kinase [Selenomonadaceae bacterium]